MFLGKGPFSHTKAAVSTSLVSKLSAICLYRGPGLRLGVQCRFGADDARRLFKAEYDAAQRHNAEIAERGGETTPVKAPPPTPLPPAVVAEMEQMKRTISEHEAEGERVSTRLHESVLRE